MPGLEGCLLSVPCAERTTGGDLYHVTVCNHGVFSKFLLVDVAGHDHAAARLSSRLQQPLAELMSELDNSAILEALDDNLFRHNSNGQFATAAAATYNHWDHSWTYAYAGHPFMLMRASDAHWYPLPECFAGPPAGVLGDTRYFQNEIQLTGDETLLLFSDALLDIKQNNGERLGFRGLVRLLDRLPVTTLNAFYQALVDALVKANGSARFDDDLTLIVLKHGQPANKLMQRLSDSSHRLLMRWMKRHDTSCHEPLDPTHPAIQ